MTAALLVPCYRALPYLDRLRTQVDRLAPAFDEVLLADDASPDSTADRAEALGFRVLRLPRNLGPGGARNALAAAVSCEWIHFHDVDDEVAPGYLDRVRSLPLASLDAVLHRVDFIGEDTRSLQVSWQTDPAGLARDPAATLLRQPLPTMASFLRREVFLRLGGFHPDRRCFEDGDFHFRLGASGARLAALPEVLEWSLRHEGGAGSDQTYCQRCRLAFLEDYAAAQPEALRPAIAAEAERCATALLCVGDRPSARLALALARRLGRPVPTTRNPLLRLARAVLPPLAVLELQQRLRRHA